MGATVAGGLVEHTFRSMGTHVSVLLPPGHGDAAALARDELDEWDGRLSRFRADSELSRLNDAAGETFRASELLFAATSTAIRAAHATGGTFDPLLANRLVELGYDATFDQLSARAALPAPLTWVAESWRQVILDERDRTIRLPPGTGLDLGGIAKGMAVDAAVAGLLRAGIPYAAVNAGGDLAVHGLPPDSNAWPIVVEGAGERMVTIRRGALATSTVLVRRWHVGADTRHHLLDPRSGLPASSGLVLVSVAAETCADAEVAAKVALLRGPVSGAAFLRRSGLAGLLVGDDGTTQRIGVVPS